MNYPILKYSIKLRDSSAFGIHSIFASFYSGRQFLPSNTNWEKSDLSSVGLYITAVYILSSPAILPHVGSGLGFINCTLPEMVRRVLRNFVPLTRGHEIYDTVGGLSTFANAKIYIGNLKMEIESQLAKGEVNLYGYQLGGLVSLHSYRAQLSRIVHVLEVLGDCDTPQHLAKELLVTLSGLSAFKVDVIHSGDVKSGAISGEAIPFGVRKYVRFSERHVAFVGEASQFTLALHLAFVEGVYLSVDSGAAALVSSPLGGCNVVLVDENSLGDWFISMLNAQRNVALPRDLSLSSTDLAKSVNRTSSSVNQPKVGNKRGFSSVSRPEAGNYYPLFILVNGEFVKVGEYFHTE